MEADWEFEIGPEAPVIDAHWSGYVDLGAHPEQAAHLEEAVQLPALVDTLRALNAPSSPVWTAKCDSWRVDLSEDPIDCFEMDASPEQAAAAHACYIDLLARPAAPWPLPNDAVNFCAALSARLCAVPLQCSRVDLVIRRAIMAGAEEALGVTAYLSACGESDEAAREVLGHVLAVFADSITAA